MDKKFEKVIFCQSPRDLTKVVTLCEDFKNKKILILVINVFGNYTFLKKLNLNAQIEFVPHKKIKNPFNFISMFFILNFKVMPKLKDIINADIYFFSQYFDYVTAILITKLCKNNCIYFIDNYKQNLKEVQPTLIERVFLLFFNFVFKTKLFYSIVGSFRAYFFKLPKNTKDLEIEANIPERYKESIANSSHNNLLIFEGRGDLKDYFDHYEKDFKAVFDIISRDYTIYIKPHPRLNYSPFIDQFNDIKVLNKDIPSEFLDTRHFTAIFGIESSATADFFKTNTPTFSLIPLFRFKDQTAQFYKNHLDKITNNKAIYINSLDELSKKLSEL